MTTKTFPIGVIISSVSGILVADNFGDVHEFFEWIAGEPVWTHQLVRLFDEAKPVLTQQFPDLAAIEIPEFEEPKSETIPVWVAGLVEKFGESREVEQGSLTNHRSINPLVELADMLGGKS